MYLYVRVDEEGNIAQRDEITEGEKQLAAEGGITLLKFDRRLARVYFMDPEEEWSELDTVGVDGDSIDTDDAVPDSGERRRDEDRDIRVKHTESCNSNRGGACTCR